MTAPTSTLAVITREKQHMPPGQSWRFAWRYLYAVALDGAEPVKIGNQLSVARGWAKRRAVTIREDF